VQNILIKELKATAKNKQANSNQFTLMLSLMDVKTSKMASMEVL